MPEIEVKPTLEIKRPVGRPPIVPKPEPAPVKKMPVLLKRGYFPKDPDHPKHPRTGDSVKVERGETVMLPLDEAKELIVAGFAERADDLPS